VTLSRRSDSLSTGTTGRAECGSDTVDGAARAKPGGQAPYEWLCP